MRLFSLIAAIVLASAFGATSAGASLTNGDFAAGLTGWETIGDVGTTAGAAAIGDATPFSALYQPAATGSGSFLLEFDFFNDMSSDVPDFSFPDTFFATIYFVDDINTFDLENAVFDDSIALFDMDYSGQFVFTGAVSPSQLGLGWLHYTLEFNSVHNFAIPAFEMLGLNGEDGDSAVLIDNVSLTVVPEPSTLILLGGGIVLMIRRQKHLLGRL